MTKRFGFDLDNTLIDYSKAVEEYCRIKGVEICSNIRALRSLLRTKDSSGYLWQIAQGWLYTTGLPLARPGLGSETLCEYLATREIELYIVSHKTSHTPDFCGLKPLRAPAIEWIENSILSQFFTNHSRIYFESTRELKIERIQELSLNYFVDDLVEVFIEPEFPITTKSFLLNDTESGNSQITHVRDFGEVLEMISHEI